MTTTFRGIACGADGQTFILTEEHEKNMNDDTTLRRIEQKLDELLKIAKLQPTATKDYAQKTVDDGDLDGKYGNPEVRMIPSKWHGQDFKGWKYADCPPEFLDELAGMLDAIARKQAGDPAKAKYADWSAKDAARARGWAARHRKNGTGPVLVPPPAVDWDGPASGDTMSDDIPF